MDESDAGAEGRATRSAARGVKSGVSTQQHAMGSRVVRIVTLCVALTLGLPLFASCEATRPSAASQPTVARRPAAATQPTAARQPTAAAVSHLAAAPHAAASQPPAVAPSQPSTTPQDHPMARAAAGPGYFDATSLDLTKLLPPVPANDSATTRADLEEMLRVQQTRTPAQSERARADATATVYRLADALGDPAEFNSQNLPLTDALFRKVLASEVTVVGAAKKHFHRPRPFVLEPKLEPVIAKPPDGSYPSGHSSWVHSVALVLADMVPERRAQILARADEYAYNRVVAGVHYPSDIAAGKLAGIAIAAVLYVSPSFRADLAAATTELRHALHLPALPSAPASSSDRTSRGDAQSPSAAVSPSASGGAPVASRATGSPTGAVPRAKAASTAEVASAARPAAVAANASLAPAASAVVAARQVGGRSLVHVAARLAPVRAPAAAAR